MDVFENYNLSNRNTFKLQSSCAYFVNLFNKEDVLSILLKDFFDKDNFFILGEGSNVILPKIFNGVVLHPNFLGIECINISDNEKLINVGAGESWSSLITYTLENKYLGLENLTLIPGSVGAAPIQNIGAYGVEVCDCIDSVEVFNFSKNDFEVLTAEECHFSYRDSIFKRNPSNYLIISVNFSLKLNAELKFSYAALKKRLLESGISELAITQRQLSETVADIRRERLPDPSRQANAGSFFKNPIVTDENFKSLKIKFPNLVSFPQADNSVKLSAAWLIDYCGWKGRNYGHLMVSDQHALVIINNGQATQEDLLDFAKQIQEDVQAHFSVTLEIEPVLK